MEETIMNDFFITKLVIMAVFTIILFVALAIVWKKTMSDYNIIEDDF